MWVEQPDKMLDLNRNSIKLSKKIDLKKIEVVWDPPFWKLNIVWDAPQVIKTTEIVSIFNEI